MSNFLVLFAGELQRMKKYHIFSAGFVVALLWILVLYFTEIQDVTPIFLLLIYIDATTMSILYVGATMFFEKQEGTIKTMLVSPISKGEYILSKSFANILSNMITVILLTGYAKLFKELNANLLGLLGAVVLIAFFHTLIGFLITYYSKDFTDLLMGMMKYALVFMLPIVLEQTGIIKNELAEKLFYVLPTKASMVLLQATSGSIEIFTIISSVLYLIVFSIFLYFVVLKKFDEFAVKESGV